MRQISEQQYKEISEICDNVLLSNALNIEIIAINFLHITRSSPINIKNYSSLFRGNSYFYRLMLYMFTFTRNVLSILYNFFYSIFFHLERTDDTINKVDFLFISHYTGAHNHSIYCKDSYFGDIVDNLRKNGKSSMVAYINHTNDRDVVFQKTNNIRSVLLNNSVNFFELVKIYKRVIIVLKFLRKEDAKNHLHLKIIKQARMHIFSNSTICNLMLANQFSSIVKKHSPKCIVTTYEGHAWERLAYYSSRKSHKDIKCFAYQHAPIFKYQHAIRRGISKKYNPDVILASGDIPRQQLESCKKLKKTGIYTLGSGRYINSKLINRPKKKTTCLVAPEGLVAECCILLRFVLICAVRNKHIRFIFRLPPMISLKSLLECHKEFDGLPSNVSLSDSSLAEDIKRADTVLYRGSSTVVNCVSLGLKPIYLKIDNELTIDSLYEIENGKYIIHNCEEFEKCFLEEVSDEIWQDLVTYGKKMYTPLDIKILEDLLTSS